MHQTRITHFTAMECSKAMSRPFLLLLALKIMLMIISSCRADPDSLQDFCVAHPHKTGITVNGFPCKPASEVVSDDFFFAGLAAEGEADNLSGSSVKAGNVEAFPGLNTLGLSMNRVDYAPGGINPLHSHPRATELVHVVKGELLVGFVSTAGKFYSRVLKEGESFVIPKGLVHFQYNVGHGNAKAVTVFNSQLPGVVLASTTLFGSEPAIPDEVLAKSFQVDDWVIKLLKSKSGN